MSKESLPLEPDELNFPEKLLQTGVPSMIVEYEQGPNARSRSHEIDQSKIETADDRPKPIEEN